MHLLKHITQVTCFCNVLMSILLVDINACMLYAEFLIMMHFTVRTLTKSTFCKLVAKKKAPHFTKSVQTLKMLVFYMKNFHSTVTKTKTV